MDLLGVEGVGCIPFSPLAQGMLTNKYLHGIPEDSRAAKSTGFLQVSQITDKRLDEIKKLDALAKKREQTLAQIWRLASSPPTNDAELGNGSYRFSIAGRPIEG